MKPKRWIELLREHWMRLLGILLIGAPLVPFYWYFRNETVVVDQQLWGAFGDYISGTIGTILTLLAFIYVYRTYSAQIHNYYVTGFETTLFTLIQFHHALVENLDFGFLGTEKEGRAALKEAYSIVDHSVSSRLCIPAGWLRTVSANELNEQLVSVYAGAVQICIGTLGHYFRHLYHIFKFIDVSRLPDGEKLRYAKMLRAQLSLEEIILLGLNGLTEYGAGFRDIIERYSLLHGLYHEDCYRAAFVRLYAKTAFGDENISVSLPEDVAKTAEYYEKPVNTNVPL